VHVDDHVHADRPGPADNLRHSVHVELVDSAAFGLEQAPGERQAKRVEAEPGHLRNVALTEGWRWHVKDRVFRTSAAVVCRWIYRIERWGVGARWVRTGVEVDQPLWDRAVEEHHPLPVVRYVRLPSLRMLDVQPRQRAGGRRRWNWRMRHSDDHGGDQRAGIRERRHHQHQQGCRNASGASHDAMNQ